MPEILLFGATGYTGRLTAHALAARGADFAIAGRNRSKLEELAAATGNPEVRIADATDAEAIAKAASDCRVLLSCVGPFAELGDAAVEAALIAGVHYADSAGEGGFIDRIVSRYAGRAKEAGITIAPSLGFDEVPADVALTLACADMPRPTAVVTYAVPSSVSGGTIKSGIGVVAGGGVRIRAGTVVPLRAGDSRRWAPMPAPLGLRLSTSFPLSIGSIAPLHIDFENFDIYVTTRRSLYLGIKVGAPALRLLLNVPGMLGVMSRAVDMLPEGPKGKGRQSKWTILAEASDGSRQRTVVATGRDLYGTTADLLAASTIAMSGNPELPSGVVAPVDAVGVETLHRALIDAGVTIDTFQS
jgi:short subunit dehydrogenase-like uncharacterized protein